MRRSILVIMLLTAVSGCAALQSSYVGPARTGLQPLNIGWEQHLAVTWETGQQRSGPLVSGYVKNTSPYDLANIRVLVEALDAGGQVVEQRVGVLPGDLRGGGHVYFEVPIAPGPSYPVLVFSYERRESAGLMV